MDILRSGIAFFLLKGLKKVPAPRHSDYVDFGPNKKSKFEVLVKLVQSCCVRFSYIPNMKRKLLKSLRKNRINYAEYRAKKLQTHFFPSGHAGSYTSNNVPAKIASKENALAFILPTWKQCPRNVEFAEHLDEVQEVFDKHQATEHFARSLVTLNTAV